MKNKTKYALTAAATGALVVAGAAFFSSSSFDQAVDSSKLENANKTLPTGCEFDQPEHIDQTATCAGGTLEDLMTSEKITSLKGLALKAVDLEGHEDFSSFANLESLTLEDLPVSTETVSETLRGASALKSLTYHGLIDADLNVSAKVVSLTGNQGETEYGTMSPIGELVAARTIISDNFYRLSAQSSADIHGLTILKQLDVDVVDLSGYDSLAEGHFATTRDTKVLLPKHLVDSDLVKIVTTDGAVNYSIG